MVYADRFRWNIAKIGVPDRQPGRITFTAEAPSVGTELVVLVFGDAGSEIASFIDQEGTEIIRKLLGLALVAEIVVG